MKLYLSGEITGFEGAEKRFRKAAERLSLKGYTVVNPWDVPGHCESSLALHCCSGGENGHSWVCWMKGDLHALLECDAIGMLPGWEKSRGARLEYHVAAELHLSIVMLHEEDE